MVNRIADMWVAIEWGNAPAWFAVLVAGIAATFASKNLKVAQASLQKAREEAHAAQARLIYAVSTRGAVVAAGHLPSSSADSERYVHSDLPVNQASGVIESAFQRHRVTVTNSSQEPAYDVRAVVSFVHLDDPIEVQFGTGLLLPQQKRVVEVCVPTLESGKRAVIAYELRFTDSIGSEWSRPRKGPVVDVTPREPRTTRQRLAAAWATLRQG